LRFYRYFQRFFGCLGPNFGTRCPHTGPWRAC
jgi:hypothetical protein